MPNPDAESVRAWAKHKTDKLFMERELERDSVLNRLTENAERVWRVRNKGKEPKP